VTMTTKDDGEGEGGGGEGGSYGNNIV
jgi:hypothetical protein